MCAYCVLIDSRLVYAATHARSVLESGGALPLPGPRFDLDTDHSLPRSSKILKANSTEAYLYCRSGSYNCPSPPSYEGTEHQDLCS